MNKIKQQLLFIFVVIIAIKSALVLFMHSPFIFSDEICVLKKSMEFAKDFSIKNCTEAMGVNAGDPMSFYSILIAPIYWFLKGQAAYKAVLIFNVFLTSSLIFPLYYFFRKFIKKHSTAILFTIAILFLPQFVTYEKLTLTETLFATISIWTMALYIEPKYKVHSIILGILGALTRPFGFILLIAIGINELFTNENRKKIALLYLPIIIGLTFIILISKNLDPIMIENKIASISFNNLGIILRAFAEQINGLLIATTIAPVIILLSNYKEIENKDFNKIKYFLISLIALNILIGTQHILGYLMAPEDPDPGLITRYINITIIFIYIFSLIAINKHKKFKLTIYSTLTLLIPALLIIFFQTKSAKYSLNLDIAHYFDSTTSTKGNLIKFKEPWIYYFIIISLITLVAFIKNKKKTMLTLVLVSIFIPAISTYSWLIETNAFKSETTELLKDKETNIFFIEDSGKETAISFNFWRLSAISNNNIKLQYLEPVEGLDSEKDMEKDILRSLLGNDTEYVITTLNFEKIEKTATVSPDGTGRNTEEHIYKMY